MDVRTAARHYRVSERTITRLCVRGQLPAVRTAEGWEVRAMFGENVLTVRALADAMGVSCRRVRTYCVDGKLSRALRVGGDWRIPMSEAADLLARRIFCVE